MADRRILRLIQKWLKAGVSEDGQWSESKVGTPQGAVVSPLIANVYLHYVFDLWIEAWRKKVAVGEVIVVRYADDLVAGFESRAEAERFLSEFRERLAKFGLELHAEKTRLIEFGQFAEQNRKQRGEGKPETFTSLASRITAGSGGAMALSSSGAKRPRSGWWRNCVLSQQNSSAGSTTGQRKWVSGLRRLFRAITNTMLFPETGVSLAPSGIGCAGCGEPCYIGAASAVRGRGSG